MFYYFVKCLNKINSNINNKNQIRTYLLLHEYVSMGILQDYGITVPKFKVAKTPVDVKKLTASGGKTILNKYHLMFIIRNRLNKM